MVLMVDGQMVIPEKETKDTTTSSVQKKEHQHQKWSR
jgi:hypothetical protein